MPNRTKRNFKSAKVRRSLNRPKLMRHLRCRHGLSVCSHKRLGVSSRDMIKSSNWKMRPITHLINELASDLMNNGNKMRSYCARSKRNERGCGISARKITSSIKVSSDRKTNLSERLLTLSILNRRAIAHHLSRRSCLKSRELQNETCFAHLISRRARYSLDMSGHLLSNLNDHRFSLTKSLVFSVLLWT